MQNLFVGYMSYYIPSNTYTIQYQNVFGKKCI